MRRILTAGESSRTDSENDFAMTHTAWAFPFDGQACRGLFLLGMLLFATGCGNGGKPGPTLYPATGSVFVDGLPAMEATVVLHPVDKSLDIRPGAEVDEEGNFTLSSPAGPGAPAGDYYVVIHWNQAPIPNSNQPIMGMGGQGESKSIPKDRLGGQYAIPETSGLKCTISEGPNEIPPFELKSSGQLRHQPAAQQGA